MKRIIFFAFSLSVSLYGANCEKEEIKRKKSEKLWKQCAIIQELGLSPVIPCSSDKKSEQLIWLVEQKEKDFSANILN